MANTIIQVKRSTTTTKPTDGSLSIGEPAYSYSSNVMFVGTSDSAGVLAIGGNFYVEKTNSAYLIAQAAYAAANSAGSSESLGNIYTQANNAYDKANSANVVASSAYDKANSVEFIADAGYDKANSANVFAYNTSLIASASYDKANSANVLAYDTSLTSSAAFNKANSAETIAIAAYANSNTKFSSSGGTITGDVSITGNLTVTGNVYSQDTINLVVNDPLIYLASNNYTSDIVDIGFIGLYNNATSANVYTGLYREHTDKEYYLFQGYDKEPLNNHIGAFSNNMTLAVLNADIKTSNLVLGGQNTITWITSAYNQANAGTLVASAAYDYANSVGSIASGAFDKANTANVNAANASFLTTGIVAVGVGGTGATSFTSNGILYGNTGGPLKVTSAGTEGQVLQASATGVPSFGMLDGGTF